MKMSETLLAMVLVATPFCGMAAAPAPPPPQNPSASHTAQKSPPPLKLQSLQPGAKEKNQIKRVGKMSSRPWTAIVGWHPGASAFSTAETGEPRLVLLSVNF